MDQVSPVSYFTYGLAAACIAFGLLYEVSGISFFFGLSLLSGLLAALKIVNRWIPFAVIHWIHAQVFDVFALLIVWTARWIPFFRLRQAKGNADGQPILLVHGYLDASSVWLYHVRELAQAGFGPIYGIDLGNPFLSIREYAEKVKKKAEEITEETGKRDLILIGHSMGGLVSSWYATRMAPKGSVTDVITIVSPLRGTAVAKIGIGKCAREMERGSEFIRELSEAIGKAKEIKFYHVATKTDQLVKPFESELIEGHPQSIIDDCGHVSTLFSPRVAEMLKRWLS